MRRNRNSHHTNLAGATLLAALYGNSLPGGFMDQGPPPDREKTPEEIEADKQARADWEEQLARENQERIDAAAARRARKAAKRLEHKL